MSQKNGLFGKIIVVELGILILCCLGSFSAAIINSRTRTNLLPVMTPTPKVQTGNFLQTMVAQIVSTQTALSAAGNPQGSQIPVTGKSAETSDGNGPLQVTFIDVGQGDSILIQSPDGRYGLIDGGEEGSRALEYLQNHGVNRLDMMIATHTQSDHIGGLAAILRAMPVERVVANSQMQVSGVYENFLNAIADSEAQYGEVKRGDSIPLGSLVLDVLHPGNIVGDDLKVNSLVLRMTYGKISFLFMGDANSQSDRDILATGVPLRSTILKVGDHASATSTDPGFLTAVNPEVAIYTAGKGNNLGLPAASTLDSLTAAGAKVYGTDTGGTIVILSDGNDYLVATENEIVPTPTPVPTVTPEAIVPVTGALTITKAILTSPIHRGDEASLTIQTQPGATCTSVVSYASGTSNAAGLGDQMADSSGQIRWVWKVGTNTTPGSWRFEVYCALAGKAATASIPFEVIQ